MLSCHMVQRHLQVKQQGSGITHCRTWTCSLSAQVQIFWHLTTLPQWGEVPTWQETKYLINKKVPVSFEVHQRVNRKWHHSCGQRVVKNSFTCTLTKHGWRIYFWLSSWRWIQLPKQCREYRLHSFTAQLLMRLWRPTRIFSFCQCDSFAFFFFFFRKDVLICFSKLWKH